MKKILAISILLAALANQAIAQISFRWRQISGPVQTQLMTPDSSQCVVTGLNVIGQYGYELTCTNAWGAGKDTTLVTVIGGTLGIPNDSSYRITRQEIKKLDIKVITRAGDIYMQIKSPRFQKIECALYDVTGRELAKIAFNVNKGTSYISVPRPKLSGVYILRFTTYYESVTTKVMI